MPVNYAHLFQNWLRPWLLGTGCVLGGVWGLSACQSSADQKNPPQVAGQPAAVENWMREPFAKSPQVLLTNGARFRDGQRLEGASAFLLQVAGQHYAVTAKHLIGPDGGIEPQKEPSQLNAETQSWKLFSRVGAPDTVTLGKLLNAVDADSSDALVFGLKSTTTAYQALTPRYDPPAEGEEVYLVGCPYAEAKCTQNRYPVKFIGAHRGLYFLEENEEPKLSGFSGCPVVDKNGLVIGLLSSSVRLQTGELYTVITPIKVVEAYLKKAGS